MVVQKHDLWLELVMKEAKKVKFLDIQSPKQDCLMKRWSPLPSISWQCRKTHPASPNLGHWGHRQPLLLSQLQHEPSPQCDLSARDCRWKQGLPPASPRWTTFPRILTGPWGWWSSEWTFAQMPAVQPNRWHRPCSFSQRRIELERLQLKMLV